MVSSRSVILDPLQNDSSGGLLGSKAVSSGQHQRHAECSGIPD